MEVTGLSIELRQMSVYSIADLRCRFDLVLFMGVLYHLRHPLLALDLIRAHVAEKLLVCQSLQRGERRIASMAPDYPFDETRFSTTQPRRGCSSSSTASPAIRRTGGFPTPPAWRRCCAAPDSASKPGEARTSMFAAAVTGMPTPIPAVAGIGRRAARPCADHIAVVRS